MKRTPIDPTDVVLADTRRHFAALVTSSDGTRSYRVQIAEIHDGDGWVWWPACNCKGWRMQGHWCRHAAACFGAWLATDPEAATDIAS